MDLNICIRRQCKECHYSEICFYYDNMIDDLQKENYKEEVVKNKGNRKNDIKNVSKMQKVN